ncbi:hypothetical protein LLH23_17180 [bacterium]|nr:hypothetical protein [bacterium]
MDFSTQQLYDAAEAAWVRSWEWYFHPATGLFYDYLCSTDPAERFRYLPTPEEIARQCPNPNGWGAGMEDSSINAGVWMGMVCDRFAVTGEEHLREAATRVYQGMVLCATVSPSAGFVARSVSPADRTSHFMESSRDQYTWHAYGLWRFSRSELADETQRATIREIITAVCERLERTVRPGETDYHICREDGKPGLVDKMWLVDPHEIARLPMLYAIGADLTGEAHWAGKCREYADQAARESVLPPATRLAYAFLQQQVSLEALYELAAAESPLRTAWGEALEFVAGWMEAFPRQCQQYVPVDVAALDTDWRHWEFACQSGYSVPRWPEALRQEDATVRQPGEAQLAQLMCPTWQPSDEWLALLARTLCQVDYCASVGYGLFYPLAAYWRAVRRGVVELP